ncbi:MAG: ATP-dependent helicase RecG, partial [Acidobacteriota bacterium]|nr:ATP-dependent helicase RecG [Acidobacteriota bacterium]
MSLSLDTPVLELAEQGISRLGAQTARRLGLALANVSGKRDAGEVEVEDLLNYLPMRYEDRSNLARIADLSDGVEASLDLYVRVAGGFQVGKNRGPKAPPLYIFEVTAGDPERTGKPVVVWWFVSGRQAGRIVAYYRQRFERGARFIAFGKWEWDARRNTFALRLGKPDELEMLPGTFTPPENALIRIAEQAQEDSDSTTLVNANTTLVNANDSAKVKAGGSAGETDAGGEGSDEEAAEESGVDEVTDPALAAIHVGRRVPVYRKLGEFRTKRLREIVHAVLARLDDAAFAETLPPELIERQRLASRADATRRIHFPSDDAPLAEYERARSPAHLRLIFEEFFWVALAIGLRRDERVKEPKGAVIEITPLIRERIMTVLPFSLTGAQERAVTRILEDMQSDVPMNRLLQGDVGSGKTVVALLAMLAAMENRYQAALMAPTEILADQHARNIKRMLSETPFRVELLTGSLKAAEKRRLHRDLAAGEIHAAIGTHALIQEAVEFSRLGLVVIDEQHRFGVDQRGQLEAKAGGRSPHVLLMTATPIPRTLGQVLYADLDVSDLRTPPAGRVRIRTGVKRPTDLDGTWHKVREEAALGHRTFVVVPLIEEGLDEGDGAVAAESEAVRLSAHLDPLRVGMVHGRLKPVERDAEMTRFRDGELDVLVGTTVVEVGVDVPAATMMIIQGADRFGLAQLHQLRGRVGRGSVESFCVLVTDSTDEVAMARLRAVVESNDGFALAEKDFELRKE